MLNNSVMQEMLESGEVINVSQCEKEGIATHCQYDKRYLTLVPPIPSTTLAN